MTDALNELTPTEIHYSNQDLKIDLKKIKDYEMYHNRKALEEEIWYCDNFQKRFTFEELEIDIDGSLVCPECGSYVEPITDEGARD